LQFRGSTVSRQMLYLILFPSANSIAHQWPRLSPQILLSLYRGEPQGHRPCQGQCMDNEMENHTLGLARCVEYQSEWSLISSREYTTNLSRASILCNVRAKLPGCLCLVAQYYPSQKCPANIPAQFESAGDPHYDDGNHYTHRMLQCLGLSGAHPGDLQMLNSMWWIATASSVDLAGCPCFWKSLPKFNLPKNSALFRSIGVLPLLWKCHHCWTFCKFSATLLYSMWWFSASSSVALICSACFEGATAANMTSIAHSMIIMTRTCTQNLTHDHKHNGIHITWKSSLPMKIVNKGAKLSVLRHRGATIAKTTSRASARSIIITTRTIHKITHLNHYAQWHSRTPLLLNPFFC